MPHALLLALLVSAAPPPPPADGVTYFARPLTEADLAGRSLRELSLLRNTIYARAHNVFRKRWLHEHFSQFTWYQPTGLDETLLSDLDRQNAELLDRYENALPREELLRRKEALWARHARPSPGSNFTFLALTPDGARLVAAGLTGPAQVLDAHTGALVRELALPARDAAGGIAFALTGDGAALRLAWRPAWDQPPLVAELPLDGDPATAPASLGAEGRREVALLPGDRALVLSPQGLELWALRPEPALRWRHEGLRAPGKLPTDRRGRFALLEDVRRTVVWDLEADAEAASAELDRLEWPYQPSALAEDGRVLAVAGRRGLALYELPRPEPVAEVAWSGQVGASPGLPLGRPTALALAPGAQAVFTWEGGDALLRRELPSGAVRWRVGLTAGTGGVPRWVVSPDGAVLYLAYGRQLDAWDAHTGAPLPGWRGPGLWTAEEAVEGLLLARALGEPVPAQLGRGEERNPLDDVALLDAQLTLEQLRDLSRRDLMLLRNTIAARRGKSWKGSLQGYFARMGWYRPDPRYSEARLSALDQKNLKLVRSLELSLGGPLPDRDDAGLPRFRG